jgi:nitrogen fixation NifU-like protein
MLDLKDLYQEVIVDHNRSPRNFHKLEDANRIAEGYNPLCGDRLTVYLQFVDGIITDVSFEGSGCAISVASASLMTEQLKGKTGAQAKAIFEHFHKLVTGDDAAGQALELGELGALVGVKHFPVRIKCATLCWHTLNAALNEQQDMVSTE